MCLCAAPLCGTAIQETTGNSVTQKTGAQQETTTANQQGSTFLADLLGAPPNIALKVQPARKLRFTKSQINSLLMDLRHEVKLQVCRPSSFRCTFFILAIGTRGFRRWPI